jgi:anaerobic ribonucleoside-triphosphate reductase
VEQRELKRRVSEFTALDIDEMVHIRELQLFFKRLHAHRKQTQIELSNAEFPVHQIRTRGQRSDKTPN